MDLDENKYILAVHLHHTLKTYRPNSRNWRFRSVTGMSSRQPSGLAFVWNAKISSHMARLGQYLKTESQFQN